MTNDEHDDLERRALDRELDASMAEAKAGELVDFDTALADLMASDEINALRALAATWREQGQRFDARGTVGRLGGALVACADELDAALASAREQPAAMPGLRAEAWDEGYAVGYRDGHSGSSVATNPYRKGAP